MEFLLVDSRNLVKEVETLNNLKSQGKIIFGIEVTIPELVKVCDVNLDPQHGHSKYGTAPLPLVLGPGAFDNTKSAIEVANSMSSIRHDLSRKLVVITNRADLDSIGTMAVLSGICQGYGLLPSNDRIKQISDANLFVSGKSEWKPKPLPTRDTPWTDGVGIEDNLELSALSAMVQDNKLSIDDRVYYMAMWLLGGKTAIWTQFIKYYDLVAKDRLAIIDAIESGDIQINRLSNQVVHVRSTHRAGTLLGYCIAPIVIAENPQWKFGKDENAVIGTKFTVCQWGKLLDLKRIADKLNEYQQGWGGNFEAGILGSPQNESAHAQLVDLQYLIESQLEETANFWFNR